MGCCGEQREGLRVRQCTDVTFLVIFIVFVCILLFVAAFAIVYGNPLLLAHGYDSFGNICGKTNEEQAGGLVLSGLDMSHRPYLFDLDVNQVNESIKICVSRCPDRDLLSIDDLQEFYNRTGASLCSYNFNFTDLEKETHLSPEDQFCSPLGPCPVLPVFHSDQVLKRCIPAADSAIATDVLRSFYEVLNSPAALEQLLADLYQTWPLIFILSFVSFVLSFAMVLLLSSATVAVAIAFTVTVSLACLTGTSALWWTYFETKWLLDETPIEQMLEETATNERWLLILAVLATFLTIVLLFIVFHVARNVKSLTILFKEASGFIKALPSLYLQPIITVAVLLSLFCAWMYVVLCLATANTPEARQIILYKEDQFNLTSINKFTLLQFVELSWVRLGWWVYLVALVWVSELVMSCQQMTTAGALVDWYFLTNGRQDGGARLLLTSVRRLVWYHLGSVALGSLLIALFKLPRLALRLLGLKKKPLCYERGLRYVNHNAYAVIAIEGIDFCPSARVAYQTMEGDRLHFSSINSVGDCFLFLGKCCVTAVVGCVGLLMMRQDPQLHVYAVPLLVLCVFSFYVAHSVFTLYEMAVDSLFLCVAEDQALSVGQNAFWRPHMVQALVNLCAKRTAQPESQPMF
ncbi:choline transporter-like 1 [Neocloeon triangulifer]|uniref:choline transporter-like 1 n=1 Tax=Neocloeon triangulifer TaxID=2078957 RepID=UPI00286F0C24|nr:choline transporter-like 1 [Neocloeon triangulifer]